MTKPTDRTLFELYSLKQWGEKYGWAAVEGLLDVRIGVYEKLENGRKGK